MPSKIHIIGISGNMGAGKSTLAKALSYSLHATLVSWDDFDEISQEPDDYVDWHNRGCDYHEFWRPDLKKVLQNLKNGNVTIHPTLKISLIPTPFIIFDAPLGRFHIQTGQYIDTWIHIDTPLDVSLCRHLLRDFKDPAKTKNELLEELSFYLEHSRPLFLDEPYKKAADKVIDGLLPTDMQAEEIEDFLRNRKIW